MQLPDIQIMEITLKEEKKDTIEFSDELFQSGIMVGFMNCAPVLLTCGEFNIVQTMTAITLSSYSIMGNGYDAEPHQNMIERIKDEIKKGNKFAWFPDNQWKEALQWLINNSK